MQAQHAGSHHGLRPMQCLWLRCWTLMVGSHLKGALEYTSATFPDALGLVAGSGCSSTTWAIMLAHHAPACTAYEPTSLDFAQRTWQERLAVPCQPLSLFC